MLAVTVKELTRRMYRTWADLAKPLGREYLTHSEGIQLFRSWFGPNGFPSAAILATEFASAIPPEMRQILSDLTPAQIDEMLAQLDTEEKFEAFLLTLPEPSPERREYLLSLIDSLLPAIGNRLLEQSKQFPRRRGGRPKEFSIEEQREIRSEIKRRRGPDVKLDDIFNDLARVHDVSKTTIKRVWLAGKSDSGVTPDAIK